MSTPMRKVPTPNQRGIAAFQKRWNAEARHAFEARRLAFGDAAVSAKVFQFPQIKGEAK